MAQLSDTDATPAYTERLSIPLWFWPCALAVAAFVPAEIFLGAYPLVTWSLTGILVVATTAWLVRLDRLRIRVDRPGTAAELRVDDAHIPVSFVTAVNILDPAVKRELLGPLGRADTFIIQRPWIRDAIRVEISDPNDRTPCWIISTRRPAQLAEAILAAKVPAPAA